MPFNVVRIVEGDTELTPDQGTTWGSLTIQAGGVQIRNAAATARAALIEQAAKRLRSPAEATLTVSNGVIRAGDRSVTYGGIDRRPDVLHQARSREAGEVQGSEGLQDRRQVDAARGHPGQGEGALHLHQQSACARHAARPGDPAAVGRRQARKRRRRRDQGHRRHRPGRARGQFPRGGGADRVGCDQRPRARSRRPGRNGKGCRSRRSCSSMCARPRCSATRRPAMSATPARRWARTASRSSPLPTTSRSTPTDRRAHPARSPSSATAS